MECEDNIMITQTKSLLLAAIIFIVVSMFSPCQGKLLERRLVLSTMNWEPYYAEYLPDGGPVAEITKEAFRRVGYDVVIEFLPWKRALEQSKIGEYDGLVGAFYSEERSHYFTFSETLTETAVVFASRKGRGITYSSLDDLKPYRIGVLRGAALTQEFDTAAFLKIEEVVEHECNISKLMSERVDLIVMGKFHLLQILNQKFPEWSDEIEIIHPPLKINGLFTAISKQNPDHKRIVLDFNRGLKEIQDNGMLEQIMKRHGVSENR